MAQAVLSVSNDVAAELAGVSDGVLDSLRERLGCSIHLRGNRLTLEGDEPRVREGSCAIWDYRLLHGGTPNQSVTPRPLLYMTYCRAWFWDHKNYRRQAAVRAPKRFLADLPEDLRRLLARAQES